MKQTEAQKEAKRLYKMFYDAANYDTDLSKEDIKSIAKNSALIAAKEKEKAAMVYPGANVRQMIKKHYKAVRKAIKEL